MHSNVEQIIFPIFALFALTLSVLIYGLVIRIAAIRSGKVHPAYFKVFVAKAEIPNRILQQKNHVDNLFQVPILFYTVCLMALALNQLPDGFLALAFAYVALRACHTLIHLTYNNVLHRMPVFVISNIVLIAMWVMLVGPRV